MGCTRRETYLQKIKSRKIERKKKKGGGVSFLIFLIKKTFGNINVTRKCLIKALILGTELEVGVRGDRSINQKTIMKLTNTQNYCFFNTLQCNYLLKQTFEEKSQVIKQKKNANLLV